ncbi:MAG: glycosyltransferase [Williamsia sp.]|nr:glycosyltransferase [Williamsia sp.]
MIPPAKLTTVQRSNSTDAIFSILIPTWNNLPYLQLCIGSIRKNSKLSYQLIVHINEGTDGTREWIEQQPDIDYSYSEKNIGVCYALNSCRTLATTPYILYLNDDMYVCPGWDTALWQEVQRIGHPYFFISTTAIEPKVQSNCSIAGNYGTDIHSFDEQTLLQEYAGLPMHDWQGATWPPNIVHKDVWDLVGGYSTEFSPGMLSDPDFSMKLWQAGVRIFKGIEASRVYHFGKISSKRLHKGKGYYIFIGKWGITQNSFSKYYLRRGQAYTGPLAEPKDSFALKAKHIFKRMKGAFYR